MAENQNLTDEQEKTSHVLFDSEEGIDNTEEATPNICVEKDLRHVDDDVQEEKKDVVKNRVLDQQVIIGSRCPICGSLDKQAVQLIAYRRGILSLFKKHRSKEVGIAQICRECGYFRIHAYNINETLAFLRGDTKAINFDEQLTTTKGD